MLYLASKNIYQQKRKTFVIGGIFFITTLFIFFLISFYASIDALLLKKFLNQKGHLFIQSSQLLTKKKLNKSYLKKTDSNIKESRFFIQIPFAEFTNGKSSAVGQIRTPFKEFSTQLKDNSQSIVLSSITADQLDISIGDTIYITSQTANKVLNTISLKVLDIATHIDSNLISLNTAKILISSETLVSGRYILFDDAINISQQTINSISDSLPQGSNVSSWNQFLESSSVKNTKAIVATLISAFMFICFIIVGCIQGNHIWLNMQQRKKEIGILKAIGASNYKLFLMFMIEMILIVLIFSGIAILLGVLINTVLDWVQPRITFGVYLRIVIAPKTTLFNTMVCILFPLSTGIFWSTIPSLKVRRLHPREILT